MSKTCEGCDGSGVRLATRGRYKPPKGWTLVERCDTCQRFDDDWDAVQHTFKDIRMIARGAAQIMLGRHRRQKGERETPLPRSERFAQLPLIPPSECGIVHALVTVAEWISQRSGSDYDTMCRAFRNADYPFGENGRKNIVEMYIDIVNK